MTECNFISRALASGAKTLYLDTETADIHFVLESDGQSERVPAHKTLLIAVSKVFRVMFNGQWKEKDEVQIPDVSVDDFKIFLRYFYFDQVQLSMDNIDGVMNLGNQYEVDACFNDCATLLQHNLTADNVFWIYGLAMFFTHEELKSECEAFIALNTKDVLKSTKFLECDQEMLSCILRLNSMSCSESRVFNACMKWVKNASKKVELSKELIEIHLENVFYDIRFGSLSVEKFNDICTTYGYLFSAAEQKGITEMIVSKEKQWKSFRGDRRTNPWTRKVALKCYRGEGGRSQTFYTNNVEITTFSVNKTLLLKRIYFSEVREFLENSDDSDDSEDENMAKLIIREIDPFKADGTIHRVIYEDDDVTMDLFKENIIRLSTPLIIKRDFKYEIRTKIYAEGKCTVESSVLSTEVEVKPGITVKFDKGPIVNGKNRGLIKELRFIEI